MSELKVEIEGGETFSIENFQSNSALLNRKEVKLDILRIKEGKFNIIKDDQSYNVEVVSADLRAKIFELKVNNTLYKTKVEDRFDLLLRQLGMDKIGVSAASELKAPMPGLVLKILVKEGQIVKEGEALVVLEAMKMENVLKSPAEVTIKSINAEIGVAVEKNQILIEFES